MPGHIFIVPGDIRRLACDAWLVPCSRRAEPVRFRPDHWPEDFHWQTPQGEDWWRRERRVYRLDNVPDPDRAAWLVNVVSPGGLDDAQQDAFYQSMARQALRAVLPTLAPPHKPANRRSVPLLAMPFLGGGLGTKKMVERGRLLRMLLAVLREELKQIDHVVDIALVTFGPGIFAAAQHAREAETRGGAWPELSDGLQQEARRLATSAAKGNLALFIGAGVGVGAGLPTWNGMIRQVAELRNLSEQELTYLTDEKRNILDRASYLAALVGEKDLAHMIVELIRQRPCYALSHGLLAGLPARQAITTNYDQLFEHAWDGAAAEPTSTGFTVPVRTSVIPHRWEADHHRWLLKLHGCISNPPSIVLTHESYIRFNAEWAALEGLLQAALLTRHILFVGFSLSDPNFIRILDTVRRIVRPGGAVGPHVLGHFGTALMVGGDEMFQRLYRHDLDWISLGQPPEGGRRLELFLDCLLAHTRTPSHLLDVDYESVLSAEERGLRDMLLQLGKAAPAAPRGPAWERVVRLLSDFGWHPPG